MSPRTSEQFHAIREERKAEILEAALHLFAEEGYHSASVSGIAKKAGVSKGLMYNYFGSKEDVLRTLIFDLFDVAMTQMSIVPGEVITDERFKEIIEKSVDIPLEEPQRWKLYMSMVFQNDVAELLMKEMGNKLGPYLKSLSDYFMTKGYDDPVAAMRTFSAILDGIQMHCLLDPENFPSSYAKQFLIEKFT